MTVPARPRLFALVAATLLAGLLVAVPGAARACACGAAYVPNGHTVQAGDELAFLSWAEPGIERLEMALSLTADTADLAVLVPTPSAPTVSQGDNATFDRLATLTTPPPEADEHGDGNGAGAPQAAPSVLSRTVLDDVVATVIKGGTPKGVARWLARHGYAHKPQVTPVLAGYLQDGWVFTAVKLRADQPFDGQVDPLVLTFASQRLVYPMRLSLVASHVGTVTVYTLDRGYDRRSDRAGLAARPADALRTITPDTYATGPLHTLAAAGNTKLAKFTYTDLDPASLTADFTFVADDRAQERADAEQASAAHGELSHGSEGSDGPAPWLVGLIAFVVVLAVGGLGLVVGLRRSARR